MWIVLTGKVTKADLVVTLKNNQLNSRNKNKDYSAMGRAQRSEDN